MLKVVQPSQILHNIRHTCLISKYSLPLITLYPLLWKYVKMYACLIGYLNNRFNNYNDRMFMSTLQTEVAQAIIVIVVQLYFIQVCQQAKSFVI